MIGMADRSLKRHLIISLGSVLTLFALSTLYGLFQINSIGVSLKEIAETHIPLIEIITGIESHQLEQSVLMERALRLGEGMAAKGREQQHFEDVLKEYENYSEKVNKELEKGAKMAKNAVHAVQTDEQRELFGDIEEQLRNIAQEHRDIDLHAEELFKLLRQRQLREAHELLESVEREQGQFSHELEAFLQRVEELTEQAALYAEHAEKQAYIWMLVLTGFAFSAIPAALRAAGYSESS